MTLWSQQDSRAHYKCKPFFRYRYLKLQSSCPETPFHSAQLLVFKTVTWFHHSPPVNSCPCTIQATGLNTVLFHACRWFSAAVFQLKNRCLLLINPIIQFSVSACITATYVSACLSPLPLSNSSCSILPSDCNTDQSLSISLLPVTHTGFGYAGTLGADKFRQTLSRTHTSLGCHFFGNHTRQANICYLGLKHFPPSHSHKKSK